MKDVVVGLSNRIKDNGEGGSKIMNDLTVPYIYPSLHNLKIFKTHFPSILSCPHNLKIFETPFPTFPPIQSTIILNPNIIREVPLHPNTFPVIYRPFAKTDEVVKDEEGLWPS